MQNVMTSHLIKAVVNDGRHKKASKRISCDGLKAWLYVQLSKCSSLILVITLHFIHAVPSPPSLSHTTVTLSQLAAIFTPMTHPPLLHLQPLNPGGMRLHDQ